MSFRHQLQHKRMLIGLKSALSNASRKVRLCVLPIVALIMGLLSASVHAQFTDEPAAIKIGESDFIPTARFEYLQFSNAFLTPDDPTEVTAFVIKPRATWVADRRLLSLTGIYEGAYASFSEETLNYVDHSLRANVDAELSSRQSIRTRLAFNFGHQALGTNLTLGVDNPEDTEQIEFIQTQFIGAYTYGAKDARGNLDVGLRVVDRNYQNQENLTDGRGYTQIIPYGQFSYRLSSDTRAIATLRYGSISYDQDNLSRDSLAFLTGLRFAATGKSGGEFQLGATVTEFALAGRDNQNSFIAEAELFYEPNSFSRFELTAGREIDNNISGSELAFASFGNLNWKHEWSSRFYHVADLTYRLENEECTVTEDRTLEEASGRFELNLVIKRWLHVGASIRGASRTASRDYRLCQDSDALNIDLDYESQVFGAHIRATL